ncbi:MAG: tRNA guanosine(34) transglycosylase Tgt [Treponemataceae bacterium]|nr:MAG: tRNA guanosine(34) transglycosylase Tgt [Treponemataceae bacterium]
MRARAEKFAAHECGFEITHNDASGLNNARTGVITLPHGKVITPVFMPVGTHATVKSLTNEDLHEIGFDLILANTYHLFLRPGAPLIEKAGGLHGFSCWNKNFLTDSGGFQVFSLSQFRKITEEGVTFKSHLDGSTHALTPESVVRLQQQFCSDIQMQLDVCTGFNTSEKDSQNALRITADWAHRAKDEWLRALAQSGETKNPYYGFFFPIAQGNFFDALRIQSAETVCSIIDSLPNDARHLTGCAIGGLSVGEPFEVFARMLALQAPLLPQHVPHYVMGIGTPDMILEAIANGIDMFDCVLPTRNARNGSYFTHNGALNIKKACYAADFSPLDSQCGCKVCTMYSRAYLHHLFKEQEILSHILASYHNLFFLHDLVTQCREAISHNTFTQFKNSFLHTYESGAE